MPIYALGDTPTNKVEKQDSAAQDPRIHWPSALHHQAPEPNPSFSSKSIQRAHQNHTQLAHKPDSLKSPNRRTRAQGKSDGMRKDEEVSGLNTDITELSTAAPKLQRTKSETQIGIEEEELENILGETHCSFSIWS